MSCSRVSEAVSSMYHVTLQYKSLGLRSKVTSTCGGDVMTGRTGMEPSLASCPVPRAGRWDMPGSLVPVVTGLDDQPVRVEPGERAAGQRHRGTAAVVQGDPVL